MIDLTIVAETEARLKAAVAAVGQRRREYEDARLALREAPASPQASAAFQEASRLLVLAQTHMATTEAALVRARNAPQP